MTRRAMPTQTGTDWRSTDWRIQALAGREVLSRRALHLRGVMRAVRAARLRLRPLRGAAGRLGAAAGGANTGKVSERDGFVLPPRGNDRVGARRRGRRAGDGHEPREQPEQISARESGRASPAGLNSALRLCSRFSCVNYRRFRARGERELTRTHTHHHRAPHYALAPTAEP